MPRRYWEDFNVGETVEFGPRGITREEIVAFAAEYDPQPFHLDEEAARASMLKGLAASGWHVCCFMMRMVSDYILADTAFMGAPGVEEVKWLRPLRPGASVMLRATVLEKRASRSRPEMGFVKCRYELIEAGAPLMQLRVNAMFERRAPAEAGAAPA